MAPLSPPAPVAQPSVDEYMGMVKRSPSPPEACRSQLFPDWWAQQTSAGEHGSPNLLSSPISKQQWGRWGRGTTPIPVYHWYPAQRGALLSNRGMRAQLWP